MHTGFHNEIVYVPVESFSLPLSIQNTLSFRFLLKAYLAIHVVLYGQDWPSMHTEMHVSPKAGPLLTPQSVDLKAVFPLPTCHLLPRVSAQ